MSLNLLPFDNKKYWGGAVIQNGFFCVLLNSVFGASSNNYVNTHEIVTI